MQRMLGLGIVLLLAAGLIAGLYGLELRRNREMLAIDTAGSAVGAASAPSQDLAQLLVYLDSLAADVQPSEAMQANFDTGKTLLAQARKAPPEEGEKLARQALQYLLAPAMARDEMAFVPPGSVEVDGTFVQVPAFFIDKKEVTVGDYKESASDRFPADPRLQNYASTFADSPMVMVSNYDAKAYAARQRKVLPTSAQWARAAYGGNNPDWKPANADITLAQPEPVGTVPDDVSPVVEDCMDMAENVAEWTRTQQGVEDDSVSAEPPFGGQFAVMGGDYASPAQPLNRSRFYAYESTSWNVGFRCVVEIPDTEAGARAMLRPAS